MLGILCGLESEATIASSIPNAKVACAGARPAKARALAENLVAHGAKRLISFGVAGGLEPGLPIGTVVIGTHVASPTGTYECDQDWQNALSRKIPVAHCGGAWGSETLVPTADEKQKLYTKSRCLIVDMESQCAAEIASAAKIPLAVLRIVCDGADMNVPPLVMDAINEDGSISVPRALMSLISHPQQIGRLIHVGRGMSKALAILAESAKVL